MKSTAPLPVCKAFLVCRQIIEDPELQDSVLVGVPTSHQYHRFVSACTYSFFARVTSAHGSYRLEVHLKDADGETVWRDGPPECWQLTDPLMTYDLKLTLSVIFPKPGVYDLVLLANDQEIGRQQFRVHLVPQPTET